MSAGPAPFNLSLLPNPLNELAFLPPDLAHQIQVARYVLVGTVAVFIWELLTNVQDDYLLATKFRINIPSLVYFFSRAVAFTYCFLSMLFETTPVNHCWTLVKVLTIVYPTGTICNALLFWFRIRAVFDQQKWVYRAFFLFWLVLVGANLTIVWNIEGGNIGPTKFCINLRAKSFASIAGVTITAYDFSVLCAISYQLALNANGADGRSVSWKTLIRGSSLPRLSRSILKDGQRYFLLTVGVNLLSTIVYFTALLPATYRTMFTVPNLMITNTMAAKIYRRTKLKFYKKRELSTTQFQSTMPAFQARIPAFGKSYDTGLSHHDIPLQGGIGQTTSTNYADTTSGQEDKPVYGLASSTPSRGVAWSDNAVA